MEPSFNRNLNGFYGVIASLIGVYNFWLALFNPSVVFILLRYRHLKLSYPSWIFKVNLTYPTRRYLRSRGPHFRSVWPFFFIYVLLKHLLYNRCHVWWLFLLKSASLLIFSRFFCCRLYAFSLLHHFVVGIRNWLLDAHRRREFHVSPLTFF